MAIHFLFFTPYNLWPLHTAYELLWTKELRRRGHSVTNLVCDGFLEECDQKKRCFQCRLVRNREFSEEDVSFQSIDEFFSKDGKSEDPTDLTISEMLCYELRGYPLGAWIKSSLYSRFRKDNEEGLLTVDSKVVGRYLRSAISILGGIEGFFEKNPVDTVILLNGRFVPHRVVFEVSKRLGKRVLTHERGVRANTVQFRENELIHNYTFLDDLWAKRRKDLMSPAEWIKVSKSLLGRARGEGTSWFSFSPVLSKAGLNLGNEEFALIATSSTDEIAFSETAKEIFESQLDWIKRSVDWILSHTNRKVVIRIHPNTRNPDGEIEGVIPSLTLLAEENPERVMVIKPEDSVSTYGLLAKTDRLLTYGSTLGLEAACRGIRVLVARPSIHANKSFLCTVKDVGGYEDQLASFFEGDSRLDSQEQERALKFFSVFESYLSQEVSGVVSHNVLYIRKKAPLNSVGLSMDIFENEEILEFLEGKRKFDELFESRGLSMEKNVEVSKRILKELSEHSTPASPRNLLIIDTGNRISEGRSLTGTVLDALPVKDQELAMSLLPDCLARGFQFSWSLLRDPYFVRLRLHDWGMDAGWNKASFVFLEKTLFRIPSGKLRRWIRSLYVLRSLNRKVQEDLFWKGALERDKPMGILFVGSEWEEESKERALKERSGKAVAILKGPKLDIETSEGGNLTFESWLRELSDGSQ